MSDTTNMPSNALIPVSLAPDPQLKVHELERSTSMPSNALIPVSLAPAPQLKVQELQATSNMPSNALIPVSLAPIPQLKVQELEETTNMTLIPLTPFCSILSPSLAETGDLDSSSTARVPEQPHPVNPHLKIDDDKSEPFPFTKLPAEVRNLIYRYLLKASRPIHSYWFREPTNPNFAAILQVSRLTNSEATVILYRENTFRFMARTLKVPFADEYPSRIIDIPRRFVPLLKGMAISMPKHSLLTNESHLKWCNSMREICNVMSQLVTAAPNIESITHHNWYHRGHLAMVYQNHPHDPLWTVTIERIGQHRSLKELVIVYSLLNVVYSKVYVVEPQVFPGHEHVQGVVGRTLERYHDIIKARPTVVKIPFAMNGTDPAEVRRRLGLR